MFNKIIDEKEEWEIQYPFGVNPYYVKKVDESCGGALYKHNVKAFTKEQNDHLQKILNTNSESIIEEIEIDDNTNIPTADQNKATNEKLVNLLKKIQTPHENTDNLIGYLKEIEVMYEKNLYQEQSAKIDLLKKKIV